MKSLLVAVMDNLCAIVRSLYTKHWKQIAYQIHAVNDPNNPKRGFLFDCGSADVTILAKLLVILEEANEICKYVFLAAVKEDIFILNKRKFNEETSHIIVDVSGNLNAPKLIENFETSNGMFAKIRSQLKSNQEKFTQLEIEEDWCIPTVFGYLINYPILYYQNPSDDSNCLDFVELKVFQVKSKDQTLISFSVPVELYEQSPDIQDLINDWQTNFQNGEFQIEAFISKHATVIL